MNRRLLRFGMNRRLLRFGMNRRLLRFASGAGGDASHRRRSQSIKI
jgi:hypothetical protein